MALDTMLSELRDARTTYNQKLAAFKDAANDIGAAVAPHIPPGYCVQWVQYTPHFNDGDACTFSVNDEIRLVLADGKETDESFYKSGVDLGTAVSRWGQPDETKSYEQADYDKPRVKNPSTNYMDYQKKVVEYVDAGFPAIDGWTTEKLEGISRALVIDDDVMERAFGDHARVVIYADGTTMVVEHDHD